MTPHLVGKSGCVFDKINNLVDAIDQLILLRLSDDKWTGEGPMPVKNSQLLAARTEIARLIKGLFI